MNEFGLWVFPLLIFLVVAGFLYRELRRLSAVYDLLDKRQEKLGKHQYDQSIQHAELQRKMTVVEAQQDRVTRFVNDQINGGWPR